jgi:hypothetical protein
MKIRAFWDVASCNLGIYRRFGGAYCLHYQVDDDGGSTHLYSNETTRRYISEGFIFILVAVRTWNLIKSE